MSRRAWHASYEPRIEMTPLLDVIFLLLTFFIYSLVLTVRADVLPVTLPTLGGVVEAERTAIAAITVDRQGQLFLNREAMSSSELRERVEALATQEEPPAVFVALDAEDSQVDRGPMLVQLIAMLREAGIENINIVGREERAPPP